MRFRLPIQSYCRSVGEHGLISGAAGGIAAAAFRSVATGTDFGDNILAVLPDVVGSTLGRTLGGMIGGSEQGKHNVLFGPARDNVRTVSMPVVTAEASADPAQIARTQKPGQNNTEAQQDSTSRSKSDNDIIVVAPKKTSDVVSGRVPGSVEEYIKGIGGKIEYHNGVPDTITGLHLSPDQLADAIRAGLFSVLSPDDVTGITSAVKLDKAGTVVQDLSFSQDKVVAGSADDQTFVKAISVPLHLLKQQKII